MLKKAKKIHGQSLFEFSRIYLLINHDDYQFLKYMYLYKMIIKCVSKKYYVIYLMATSWMNTIL